MFGLQLFVSGFFQTWPTVLVGLVPVLLTAALVGWTFYKVVEETRLKFLQNSDTAAKDSPQQMGMVLQSPNGDSRVLAIEEFNALYEPTREQQMKDPLLANQGFRPYRSTTQVWAHRLTADDVIADFPKGCYISSSGAPMSVHGGQYIAVSFPRGDEVSIVGAEQFEDEYLESSGEPPDGRVSPQAEVLRTWDIVLRREESIHAKSTKVHAKLMTEEGTIDTVVDGNVEARRPYDKGDYLVCGSRGGRYPMQERHFSSRYNISHTDPASDPVLASAGFKLFKAKGKVCLHPLHMRLHSLIS